MEWVILVLVMLLAFANGANDVSKSISTLIGSGLTTYRLAVAWGTWWTLLGAGASALTASLLLRTFSQDVIVSSQETSAALAAAVLFAALAWVLFASRAGLPVSTTHALTGGLVGAAWAAFGIQGVLWHTLIGKVALPLLLSPLLALFLSATLHPHLKRTLARWEGSCLCVLPASAALVAIDAQGLTRTLVQPAGLRQTILAVPTYCDRHHLRGLVVGIETIHWISSGLTAFARGMNDAPKIVAMLLLADASATWGTNVWSISGGVAIAMALGSFYGGRRVTTMLAERIIKMNHTEGFSANLTTASLVLLSGTLGLPVSTTHVSGSSIIGIGLQQGMPAIRWSTVRDLVLAWAVTLPLASLLGYAAYNLFHRLT